MHRACRGFCSGGLRYELLAAVAYSCSSGLRRLTESADTRCAFKIKETATVFCASTKIVAVSSISLLDVLCSCLVSLLFYNLRSAVYKIFCFL